MPINNINPVAMQQLYHHVLAESVENAIADQAKTLFSDTLLSAKLRMSPPSGELFSRRMANRYSRLLYRMGRYVQVTAQRLIKPRKSGGRRRRVAKKQFADYYGIPSAPYSPPRIPLYRKNDSPVRSLLAFDVKADQIIIGPRKFKPSPNLRITPTGTTDTIVAVLEHGGRQTLKTEARNRTINYKPRPFMSIALLRSAKTKTFKSLLNLQLP